MPITNFYWSLHAQRETVQPQENIPTAKNPQFLVGSDQACFCVTDPHHNNNWR